MKRGDIIERLYELRSSDSLKESVDSLMNDVLSNKITTEDAESKLRDIDPKYIKHEFLQNLKGKPIYKNIIEYKKDKLTNIQIAKMVSSLITQILIQTEQFSSLDPKSLQIDTLLEIIKEYSEDPSVINRSKIDDLLSNYGWEDL